jgi:hypothetical protein
MTDEQILELVKEHFTEEWCEEDGCGWTEFAGKPDAFLKFARVIYELGYNNGYSECSFDMGDENV